MESRLELLFLTSTGSSLINSDTQILRQTHTRQVELPVIHASAPAFSFGDEHGIMESASLWGEGCGEGGKGGHFPFFAVGKQPKPQCLAPRQGGFKQPLIH